MPKEPEKLHRETLMQIDSSASKPDGDNKAFSHVAPVGKLSSHHWKIQRGIGLLLFLPQSLNSMPDVLRQGESVSAFKTLIKTFFYHKAFPHVACSS